MQERGVIKWLMFKGSKMTVAGHLGKLHGGGGICSESWEQAALDCMGMGNGRHCGRLMGETFGGKRHFSVPCAHIRLWVDTAASFTDSIHFTQHLVESRALN